MNIIMPNGSVDDTATNEIIEANSDAVADADAEVLIDTSSGFNPYDTATLYRRPHFTEKDGKS